MKKALIFAIIFLWVHSAIAINLGGDSGFDKGKLPANQITPDCSQWSKNLSCTNGDQQSVDNVLDQLSTSGGGGGNVGIGTTGWDLYYPANGSSAVANPYIFTSPTGNVGINSLSPGVALDVIGTVRASGGYLGIQASQVPTLNQNTTGTAATVTTAAQPAITSVGTLTSLLVGNNVGIGSTVPGQSLDVTGTVRDLGEIVNGNVGIGTNLTTTSALTVMNGNVGIGTWIPGAVLEEEGTGNVIFNGANITGGNVGIGIKTPDQLLEVNGNIDTNSHTLYTQSVQSSAWGTSSNDTTMKFQNHSYTQSSGQEVALQVIPTINQSGTAGISVLEVDPYLQALGSGNKYLLDIGTDTAGNGGGTHTTLVDITNTGNVGINSTLPGQILDVQGTIRNLGEIINGNPSSTTLVNQNPMAFQLFGTSQNVYIPTSGNVGIGSLVPGQSLDVVGTIRALGLQINNGVGQQSLQAGTLFGLIGTSNNVYVTTSGNVGIGTWIPTTALSIVGNMNFVTANPTVSGSGISYNNTSLVSNGSFPLGLTGTPITLTGNVGIGSTLPGSTLDVNGTIKNSRFFGNVGIGTSYPGQVLDVTGSIRAITGDLIVPSQKSTTGQRYVCIDTAGDLISSAVACVGT